MGAFTRRNKPMNAPPLTGVPQMMGFTLRARADEHRRPDALFRDARSAAWMQRLPWTEDLARWYDGRYQVCIALGTHGRLTSSRKGRARQRATSRNVPVRRKCAPRSIRLRITGNSRTKFMKPPRRDPLS